MCVLQRFAVYCNVIDEDVGVGYIMYEEVHGTLECCVGVAKSERHNQKL